jgi:hypothetical protein
MVGLFPVISVNSEILSIVGIVTGSQHLHNELLGEAKFLGNGYAEVTLLLDRLAG